MSSRLFSLFVPKSSVLFSVAYMQVKFKNINKIIMKNEKKIEEAEKEAKEKETKKTKIKTIYIVAGSAGIVIIGIISFVVIRRIHEKRVRGF